LRANGISGSSYGAPRVIIRNGTQFATKCMRCCARRVGDAEWERSDPDELWRQNPKLRKEVYPILADVGETAQFLAMKRLALNVEGRVSFLYWLYDDLAPVLARLRRLAEGDYGNDEYAKRFPKFEGPDSGDNLQQLFERWVAERKPAYGTIESWSYVFAALQEKFGGRSAGSITPDEAKDWIRMLITSERSAHTVKKTYLNACKTVFGWALEHKLVSRNPFAAFSRERQPRSATRLVPARTTKKVCRSADPW
jgi:hypothetical protein